MFCYSFSLGSLRRLIPFARAVCICDAEKMVTGQELSKNNNNNNVDCALGGRQPSDQAN